MARANTCFVSSQLKTRLEGCIFPSQKNRLDFGVFSLCKSQSDQVKSQSKLQSDQVKSQSNDEKATSSDEKSQSDQVKASSKSQSDQVKSQSDDEKATSSDKKALSDNKKASSKSPSNDEKASSKGKRASSKRERTISKILSYCSEPRTMKDIMDYLGLTDRGKLKNRYLNPLLGKSLKMTQPNSPKSPTQRYVVIDYPLNND